MNEIAIVIPARLDAKRLPSKPLKMINNKEMILHVYDSAKRTGFENIIVASPDEEIIKLVKKNGGKAVLTKKNHPTGTDRVFEVFNEFLEKKPKIIINLQGDMPNVNSNSILMLADHMLKNNCDIGTLAGSLKNDEEKINENVVKVITEDELIIKKFSKAKDFFRKSNNNIEKKIYHHIGIYGFTNKALIRYVSLKRSKLEIERNLEQLRALEDKMIIDVGYVNDIPLSIDTEEDLKNIKKILK